LSEAAKESTRRAWRELGFYCGRDTAAKEWRIVGSVTGLKKFAAEIQKYAREQRRHSELSRHQEEQFRLPHLLVKLRRVEIVKR
jgi:hypothetical protein